MSCCGPITVFLTMATTCELATRGGGCPNVKECVEVCRPCYRGIGQILVYCHSAGGGVPFDECMCRFTKGAPCNPSAPPRCPNLWPPQDAGALNGTTTLGTHHVVYLNQTHALIQAFA
ncbi:hypothetical protein HS088_TW14G01039 [Tripterygium wilfordii]|uniref:Uncharacterized protein n=1 Tax=Tripterygium wilfordii TaxID=458696 RepID=A0A7J7CS56_TRIWF|nr:hypothetical protein HS088_TW14G01039 [Tripterygium wilfordii]